MFLLFGLLLVPWASAKPNCTFKCERKGEKGRTCNLVCDDVAATEASTTTKATTKATTTKENRDPTDEKPHCMFNCARSGGSERECNLVCTGMNVQKTTTPVTQRSTTPTTQATNKASPTPTTTTMMTTTPDPVIHCEVVCRKNNPDKNCQVICSQECMCNAPSSSTQR